MSVLDSDFKYAWKLFGEAKDFDNEKAKENTLREAYNITISLVSKNYKDAKELQSNIRSYAEAFNIELG